MKRAQLRFVWEEALRQNNFRYFVLKARNLFDALTDEELEQFNNFLVKIEKHRESKNKPAFRDFWVAGRHWKCGPEVKRVIEEIEGITLKERENNKC